MLGRVAVAAAPSLPAAAPRTHGDDLGVELCRQAGGAGLGAEEAVEGLHGAGGHQLQGHGVRKDSSRADPLCSEPQNRPCPTQPHGKAPSPTGQPPSSIATRPASPGSPWGAPCSDLAISKSCSPAQLQARGHGDTRTLTTWLRVMTLSRVSQHVFTAAAGQQGSTSRSRDRTCRVVVASLAPGGAEQHPCL